MRLNSRYGVVIGHLLTAQHLLRQAHVIASIVRDRDGRAVVIGSVKYAHPDPGVEDRDFSIFRVHASETVFADAFETP